MHIRPPAILQRRICQVYQYVILDGVLVGWMFTMGVFHLLKPAPIEPQLFHQPLFVPWDMLRA